MLRDEGTLAGFGQCHGFGKLAAFAPRAENLSPSFFSCSQHVCPHQTRLGDAPVHLEAGYLANGCPSDCRSLQHPSQELSELLASSQCCGDGELLGVTHITSLFI